MSEPSDAMGPQRPAASVPDASPAAPDASSGPPDDRAVRRAALRDLATMIGAEVFY